MKALRLGMILALLTASLAWAAQPGRPLECRDLLSMKRLADLSLAPNGRWAACVESSINPETYARTWSLLLVPLAGGEPQAVVTDSAEIAGPVFSPDSRALVYTSARSGSSQLYRLPLDSGAEPVCLTAQPGGITGAALAADGKRVLYTAQVLADSQEIVTDKPGAAPRARIFDTLFYRHWAHWRNGAYSHLFVAPAEPGAAALDLTPGKYDCPPQALGSPHDFAISPDNRYVYFVSNRDPVVAVNTNNDLWRVGLDGQGLERITSSPGNDNLVLFSPKGAVLAYRAMKRAGFESDKQDIWLLEPSSGKRVCLTGDFDRSADELVWDPKGETIYFTAESEGMVSLFKVAARLDGPVPKVTRLTESGSWSNPSVTPDGKNVVALRQGFTQPAEVYVLPLDGKPARALTSLNQAHVAELELNPVEPFWFEAEDGVKVEGFLVRPPQFDQTKKYPLVYLIHGGPQGAWTDEFHYRWNAQLFASWGYVAVMVNPRGSTGYGQKFTDQISGDWGGKAYRDLMRGLDYVLANYAFVDSTRMGAAGASYGGYMINWIEGHNRRFKCLVNHDGVYNLESMYASTEELWFPEWEFGGTPWDNPTLYHQWSPHLFARDFATPMLVIHGDRDYRVPPEQGLMVYTTLQRKGIESKMLYFPDEGHWVQNPRDFMIWNRTIREWLDKHLKSE
ncbi:S9 family peptidase [bacterium]|nr:S9 family peptidase [bacterium]